MNNVINYNGEDRFEIFNFENLGSVRTSVGEGGQPLFCLKDVSDVLGINNPRDLLRRIDEPYVDTIYVGVQTGIKTNGEPAIQSVCMNFVNEAGLYQAIGQSRKPAAKRFMNWIFSEVIPSIRRTGSYSLENDSSLPLEIRYVNGVTRAINHMNTRICKLDEREEAHYKELSERADIAQHRQELIIEEGYHTVFQYAHFMGVDTNTIDINHLGRVASKICREMGIPTGKYPDGKYMINTYPYKVLNQVFNELVFTTQNSN